MCLCTSKHLSHSVFQDWPLESQTWHMVDGRIFIFFSEFCHHYLFDCVAQLWEDPQTKSKANSRKKHFLRTKFVWPSTRQKEGSVNSKQQQQQQLHRGTEQQEACFQHARKACNICKAKWGNQQSVRHWICWSWWEACPPPQKKMWGKWRKIRGKKVVICKRLRIKRIHITKRFKHPLWTPTPYI